MRYNYQLVIIPKPQLLAGNEQALQANGVNGFRVKNTWIEQNSQGVTLFIFLMEKEIPQV
jgi:hypothetical protein